MTSKKLDCGCKIQYSEKKARLGVFKYHFKKKCKEHSGHEFEPTNARLEILNRFKDVVLKSVAVSTAKAD
jgi:hypothetical protein